MSSSLVLKAKGLFTLANPLSEIPEGALVVADDVVIDKDGLISPRRGFDRLASGFASASNRANQLTVYQSYLVSHYATSTLGYYDSGWNNYSGTYAVPASGTKVRFAESNQNLYFTTSTGVKKLDAYNGTPIAAGAYKGLTLTGSTTGASGFLDGGKKVAYRLVWYRKDANNNYIYGAPSERCVVTNSLAAGNTRDVSVTATVPSGVDTTWYYQLYRSATVDSSGSDPSDELGLVYEAKYVSGTTITITDNTTDSLRGATIYTAASQEGIAQANEVPPFAKDIVVFKGSMFYANTKTKHRLYLTLLAVGGSSGIAAADTVTIAGTVYTANATEDSATGKFAVVTGGSASQNIADTAKSLVKIINAYASNTSVYAYYLSGPDDLPGKILIEERTVGGATFYAVSSRATCWSPQLPTSGTTVASSNDTYKHGLYFSKYQQPESVPLANYFLVGSADKNILRIIPLRDSLFILKEDGIYRLSGEGTTSFRVDLFDSTAKLIGAETAVVLNNQIFCLTDQGVVAITETGVSVVSRPIEDSFLELFGADLDSVKELSFGIGYESDRKYILFTISNSADTSATQAFVFNTFTNSWTRWVLESTCGIVNPADDKLYLGDADSEYINKEIKNFNFRDHVDYGFTATATSYDSANKYLYIDQTDQIEVGDIIYQSASVYSIVSAVSTTGGYVTLQFGASFTAGAQTVYKAIDCNVEWAPLTGGNPGVMKHFRELSMLFKGDFVLQADIKFASDLVSSDDTVTVTGTSVGLWGLFPWGGVPWGGTQKARPVRTYVPQTKQRCSQLRVKFRHKVGYSRFELAGLSVVFTPMSEKVMR